MSALMHGTRATHRAVTAPALLLGALAMAACAAAPQAPSAAPPAPEPPQFAAAPYAPGAGIDGAAADLARAEDEMQRALALAGGAPVPPAEAAPEAPAGAASKPSAAPPPASGPSSPSKAPSSNTNDDRRPDALSAVDACSVACRALESMRRSTDQLCGLAGAGDMRCADANARVDRAIARVRASCPSCAQAAPRP
jgi:hypothetical protein